LLFNRENHGLSINGPTLGTGPPKARQQLPRARLSLDTGSGDAEAEDGGPVPLPGLDSVVVAQNSFVPPVVELEEGDPVGRERDRDADVDLDDHGAGDGLDAQLAGRRMPAR
jgi:hypothetical protein